MTGFEYALPEIKLGIPWRRMAWKPGKAIVLHPGSSLHKLMPFIALMLPNGQRAPWTPTRCDLLERDWERADGS